MKRVRYSVYSLLFVLTLVAWLAVLPGIASATSAYDNSYQGTVTLRTGSTMTGQACDPADVTFDWASYLTDSSKWYGTSNRSAERSSFLSALANDQNGAWGVHQYSNGSLNIVEFWWTEDPSARLEWSSDGVDITTVTAGANIHLADIVCQNYYYGGGSSIPVVGPTGMIHSYKVSTSLSSSLGYVAKPLFIHGFDTNYPSGYAGEPIPEAQPPVRHAAMGDSYSTAEGNPSFEVGTDNNDVNECHRSPQAYPRLLQNQLNLGLTAFVACSGATTNDVLGIPEDNDPLGKWNEPAQIDALSDETEVVTITIGGNDVKFKEFAEKCVSPLSTIALDEVCDEFTPIYDEVTGLIANSLPAKLRSVYARILIEAPNAKIYVGGYPRIAPFKYISDPFDQDCGGLYDEVPNNWGDARAAYEVVNLINEAIEDAIDAVNNQYSTNRLHYVDVSDGAFVGHDVCSSDSYFNGIDAFNPEYSLHPDSDGHVAYATEFEDAMS